MSRKPMALGNGQFSVYRPVSQETRAKMSKAQKKRLSVADAPAIVDDADPYFGQYLESQLRLEAYGNLINELLPGAPPMGAYCMGFSFPCLRSRNPRMWPTRDLLLRFRECVNIEAAERILAEWQAAAARVSQ